MSRSIESSSIKFFGKYAAWKNRRNFIRIHDAKRKTKRRKNHDIILANFFCGWFHQNDVPFYKRQSITKWLNEKYYSVDGFMETLEWSARFSNLYPLSCTSVITSKILIDYETALKNFLALCSSILEFYSFVSIEKLNRLRNAVLTRMQFYIGNCGKYLRYDSLCNPILIF